MITRIALIVLGLILGVYGAVLVWENPPVIIMRILVWALVGVVLMQRSEGGGLGVGSGGSPGGLMSARGAADFLTRTTKWLAVVFVALSIVLAALAVNVTSGVEIDTSLERTIPAGQIDPLAPVSGQAANPGAAGAPAQSVPAPSPAQSPAQPADPLADVAN